MRVNTQKNKTYCWWVVLPLQYITHSSVPHRKAEPNHKPYMPSDFNFKTRLPLSQDRSDDFYSGLRKLLFAIGFSHEKRMKRSNLNKYTVRNTVPLSAFDQWPRKNEHSPVKNYMRDIPTSTLTMCHTNISAKIRSIENNLTVSSSSEHQNWNPRVLVSCDPCQPVANIWKQPNTNS